MTDWPVKTLGEVCEVLDNLRKPITKRDRTSGDYPYYGATGIVDYVGDYIFDERLVLVGEDGAKWGAGERTAFIAEDKYWVNNHAHVLRCKQGVLVDSWLANFLTMSDLNRYVSGLTVPKLNQGSLVSIEIPVPPLDEQKRLVALLDAVTDHVAELTACYQQARTHANNLFTSALRDALESNPDWPVKTLGDFCEIYQPQTIGMKDMVDVGKYVVYGANGPIGLYDRFNHEESEVTVTCRGATCGTVNVTPPQVWITGNAMVVRPFETEMTKQMMRYVLEGLDYSSIITGAAQPQITRQTIAPTAIQVPPLEDQKRIVTRLDLMKAKTAEMVAAYDAKLTAAKNLRQSILEAAFAGDL